jgi:CRP/FNR family cyclic AMP-dependent transcriptional regulator
MITATSSNRTAIWICAAIRSARKIILVNQMGRRIDSCSSDPVRSLARLLVELATEHRQLTSSGVDIDIPPTQQELASLIASSRESVVRALRSLRSRDLVATGRRRITVHDLSRLKRVAG